MKYQHILNGEILFETDDVSTFFGYLMSNPKAQQVRNSILYNLLEKSNGYICNMVSAKDIQVTSS